MGGRSTPRPGRFTPKSEINYPLYGRLGGPQGRSNDIHTRKNILTLLENPVELHQELLNVSSKFRNVQQNV